MEFQQFYLGCLAHASYLIGSEGEAAVVDPRRDVDEYVAEADRRGLRIRWVIETHLHADFVSGHRELSERTGAAIVFGAKAGVAFPHRPVKDGDEIRLGRVVLRFLETPGHTPESMSILVVDTAVSDQPSYCFGPTTGPSPTAKKPGGDPPVAKQEVRAAAACACTDATLSPSVPCATVTAQQSRPTLPEPSAAVATMR